MSVEELRRKILDSQSLYYTHQLINVRKFLAEVQILRNRMNNFSTSSSSWAFKASQIQPPLARDPLNPNPSANSPSPEMWTQLLRFQAWSNVMNIFKGSLTSSGRRKSKSKSQKTQGWKNYKQKLLTRKSKWKLSHKLTSNSSKLPKGKATCSKCIRRCAEGAKPYARLTMRLVRM